MKFGININGDSRNVNVTIGAQKEEGEDDFFSGFKNGLLPAMISEDDEEDDIIDEVEAD